MDEDEELVWIGVIEVDGRPMKFWLPQNVSVEELDIEWVPA